ncbi:hypothetical protein B0H13DRAFT_1892883 [Mycena leptocephala]|nr:hypothetical protein B0H13DRAFT_1892883 [Mycena leptocephala]
MDMRHWYRFQEYATSTGALCLDLNSSRAVKKTKTGPFQNSEVRFQSRAQNRNPEVEVEFQSLCSIHEDGQPRKADGIKTKKRCEAVFIDREIKSGHQMSRKAWC